MSNNILVIGEAQEGVLRNVSFEAISAAKQIDSNAEILAVLMGQENVEEQAKEMIYYGADRAIVVTDEKLKNYSSEAYAQVLMEIVSDESPAGIVMGHTSVGKDLSPKIAARLDSGLVSDIVNIEAGDGQIVYTRPI